MKTGGIIVEGAEQQGKTTFCKKLQERLGIEVIHYGPAAKDYDYFNGYFVDIDQRGGPFVFDRSYISELSYGKVFSRNNITTEIKDKIESKFSDLGYFMILLELNRPWIGREETVTKEQNEKVKVAYREIYPTLNIDKFIIEPNEQNLEFVISEYKRRK